MKNDLLAFLVLIPILFAGWAAIQVIAAFILTHTKYQRNWLFIASVFCWLWAVICILFIKFYMMG